MPWIRYNVPDFQLVRGRRTAPPLLPLCDQACQDTGYSRDYAATCTCIRLRLQYAMT